jgi:hypothetical protein
MLTPEAYSRSYQGIITKNRTTGLLEVNVMGNTIQAMWSDPLTLAEGDTVLVQFGVGRTQATNTATVVGKVTSRARPARGTVTVVPPSSPTITVQGSDGINYTATYITSYTPTVSDVVTLLWTSTNPTVVGKVAAAAAPPPPPPPVAAPPPAPTTGTSSYWCTDSNTYWPPGGWGSWAGGRGRVYQGNYGAGDVYGAFFYNGATSQMAGRTIGEVRLALGNRIAAGSYNSPVTIHIYATSNSTRPGGNISAIAGPVNVTAWPGQGLTEYNITALAPQLQAGGGIAIYGNPYAGFLGIPEQPDSGRLTFDWRM